MANNKKYELGTPTVTTNTYAGELALPYLTSATASNSIANGYVTVLSGIRNKAVLSNFVSANPVVSSTCGSSDTGNTTLDETVLTTNDVMVNEALCRKTLYPTWVAQQMNGNRNGEPSDFIDFAMSVVAGKTAEQLETGLYQGSAILGKGFISQNGTLTNANVKAGQILAGATTNWVQLNSGSATTNANIDTAMSGVYDKAVAVCPAILGKEDVQFLLSPKMYGLFLQYLADKGNSIFMDRGVSADFSAVSYLGVPVKMAYGMPDEFIILGQSSNMFAGTNLGTDATEVQVIPRYQYDGSDFIQLIMRFGWGVQVGVNTDIILGSKIAVS